MQAAAVHEEAEEWAEWLEERLVDIAMALPSKPCLGVLFGVLEGLEAVVPVERWFHLRAKQVAASGAVT